VLEGGEGAADSLGVNSWDDRDEGLLRDLPETYVLKIAAKGVKGGYLPELTTLRERNRGGRHQKKKKEKMTMQDGASGDGFQGARVRVLELEEETSKRGEGGGPP